MENNEASVYDINDLSPTEILNEGDDRNNTNMSNNCLLYTSDAADE